MCLSNELRGTVVRMWQVLLIYFILFFSLRDEPGSHKFSFLSLFLHATHRHVFNAPGDRSVVSRT